MQPKSKKGAHTPAITLSTLKYFLETHPIVPVIGMIVGTGSIIIAVMTYISTSQLEVARAQHKAEVENLSAKHEREIVDKTLPLEKIIADLNFRLSSIERRLPGSGPAYLDVSSIIIGPETVKTLERRYKPFGNQDFFVAVPPMAGWSLLETNELDYGLSISQPQQPLHPIQQHLMRDSKLYVWKEKSQVEIIPLEGMSTDGKKPALKLRPAIIVQKIDGEFFRDRMHVIDELSREMENAGNQLDNLLANLPGMFEKINKFLGEVSEKMKAAGASIEFQPLAIPQVTSTRDEREIVRRKAIDALTMFSSADLSSFVMMSVLSGFVNDIGSGLAQHRILSAQKKGAVFYIQSQFTFNNVSFASDLSAPKLRKKVDVDQEIFFFSYGSEGFLVKTILPPTANRAEAFSWIQSWLTGLRVPLG